MPWGLLNVPALFAIAVDAAPMDSQAVPDHRRTTLLSASANHNRPWMSNAMPFGDVGLPDPAPTAVQVDVAGS